jgi:decaprenylphospho-beta-D-erythro-pentofuranosid-2-ulose 2-reductase
MKNIVIVGATSAIATACAREWAAKGARFFLVARNRERLEQVAADLIGRGAASATPWQLDIDRLDEHAAMFAGCAAQMDSIDIVLIASGTLPDQAACQNEASVAAREFQTNALSLIALLTPIANRLEAQRHGTLAVISSVAGDRGRPSNYLYGSAKAALQAFLEGLRARLFKADVHVIDVRPGFVATPMTAGLPLPERLVATPEKVAQDIVHGIDKQRDVLYTPWFWWGIMLIIRSVPRFLFKRASL